MRRRSQQNSRQSGRNVRRRLASRDSSPAPSNVEVVSLVSPSVASSSSSPAVAPANPPSFSSSSSSSPSPSPPALYYCHVCECRVTVRNRNEREVECSRCNDSFVEELGSAQPDINSNNNTSRGLFSRIVIGGYSDEESSEDEDDDEVLHRFRRRFYHDDEEDSEDEEDEENDSDREWHGHHPLGSLFAMLLSSPASMEVVLSGVSNQPPGNFAVGRNYEQLLATLFQNARPSGPPPAARSAIDALAKVKLSKADLPLECVVCQDTFEEGVECVEMPCKHRFHENCIRPWLEKHNTCPMCRAPIASEDDEQRQQRTSTSQRNSRRSARSNMRYNNN